MNAPRSIPLGLGEAAPWFRAAALEGSSDYVFDTVAGRPVLMLFFGSAGHSAAAAALAAVAARRTLFDDQRAVFFGVTIDPEDAASGRIRQRLPGLRFFLDYDGKVSRAFGAMSEDRKGYRAHWLLLDANLRVAARLALGETEAALDAFAAMAATPPMQDWAPVLAAPNIFEPELCRRLIDLYEANGGEESGFMRDSGGKTRLVLDPRHKVRRDCLVKDTKLARQLNLRLIHRLLPMVHRAFAFRATRVERLLVACYEPGGHFRRHRDNTTMGTAHRRFAVTINLNVGEYEGGDLIFPEYGARAYRAQTGGAIVFSCSLLHEAQPVTEGRRFAFLPFLYDEEGAQLRERNAGFLEGELANYRASDDLKVE